MAHMKIVIFFLGLSHLAWAWTHVGNNVHGWKNGSVTFYVNSANCPVSSSTLDQIVDTALTTWNGVTDSNLVVQRTTGSDTVSNFLAGTSTQVPLILCDPNFSTEVGSAGADVIPAATFKTSFDNNGNIIYSGILLNAQAAAGANISNLSAGQVELTLAHEMGHALGLGHSSQEESLMYYSLGTKQFPLLTEDDIDGIVHIYPRNELTGGTLGCSSAISGSHTTHDPLRHNAPLTLLVMLGVLVLGRKLSQTLCRPKEIRPEQPLSLGESPL
jgi:Matrixin